MTDVEMVLEHDERRGWRALHFPHESYDEAELTRKNKDALIAMIQQLNTNGRACEHVVQTQAETIDDLRDQLKSKISELRDAIDDRQEWCERTMQLQQAGILLIRLMGDDIDDD